MISPDVVFTAWGTAPGGQWENSLGSLITQAKSAGLSGIAVQATQAQAKHVQQIKDGGLKAYVWDVIGPGWKARLDSLNTDGLIVQVEGPGQFDGAVAGLLEDPLPGKPRAVITTYGGLDTPAKWGRLAGLGVEACLVECYAADDPVIHADLDKMLWQGTQYGIPKDKLFATVGTYRGERPTAYRGLNERAGMVSLYLAEMMGQINEPTGQWAAWEALLATPTPTPAPATFAYWDVIAGGTVLHSEKAITYPNGSTGLEKAVDWIDGHLDVVRAAKAVELRRVLR